MKTWTLYLLILSVIFSLCACSNSPAYPTQPNVEQPVAQRSDSCDYILCKGTDTAGNTYELVANQEETALGYEITVGIIKNNDWFYPMSSNFPFLNNGLFPMEDGTALTRVTSAKLVASYIYFIDSGAFAMVYATISPMRETMVIYNCNTKQSYTYYDDDYTWLLWSNKFKSRGSVETYDVISYGKILTDDNLILMYKDVSEPFDWNDPKKYDWLILDTMTMEIRTIASNVVGNYPRCCLSEGLFFAADDCFYNVNAEKVIDLSKYNIDIWENGGLYFRKGKCTFIAENDLGTEFEITIDTSGRVLSETKK